MEEQFKFTKKYRTVLLALMGVGLLVTSVTLIISKPAPSRIWANILMNNQFFLGIALGGAFFIAVHRIAWSGWHTLLQKLPDAMTSFLPVAFVLMLLIYFGREHIYHWTDPEHVDAVIEGKKAWLNVPFFFARMVFYFAGWIILTWVMRMSTQGLAGSEDIKFHTRRKIFAGLFLVFYAITVSTSSWDWIMSIDAHWFSTIFGWYVFIGMFVTALSFIILLVWFLKRAGYMKYIRTDHVHDLSTLLFSFSIFWAYLWFSQYLLIWYGHLPEETVYYIERLQNYKILFFLNLGLNFVVPFFGLMRLESKRNLRLATIISAILIVGHWVDYWLMIMPGSAGANSGLGVFEVFMTLFYSGLFLFVVLLSLARGPLVVKNDPFLEESMTYVS